MLLISAAAVAASLAVGATSAEAWRDGHDRLERRDFHQRRHADGSAPFLLTHFISTLHMRRYLAHMAMHFATLNGA